MSDAIALRRATPVDLGPLFELYGTAFRSHIEEIWGWDEAWQRDNFKKDFERSTTFVFELGGTPVGYLQTADDPSRLYLRSIALVSGLRGNGLGTDLVKGLQDEAREGGLPIELVVFRTNERACEFYRRLGFEVTGRTDDFIEMSWRPTGPG